MADNGDVLKYKYGQARTYLRDSNQPSVAVGGVPVTVEDASEDSLRIAGIGTALAVEEPVENATFFVEYLKSWGESGCGKIFEYASQVLNGSWRA